MTYTYKNVKDGDVFRPKVKLYSTSDHFLAEDAIVLHIEVNDGSGDEDAIWECDFEVDYSMLILQDNRSSVWYYHTNGPGLHGPWLTWYSESRDQFKLAQCYFDDKIHGRSFQWHENGNKKTEAHYEMGVLHGPYLEWWENGNIRKDRNYHTGEYHGDQAEWYENGNRKLEVYYNMGKGHGIARTWHENGNKHTEGTVTNGLRTGIWYEWWPDGSSFWCVDWDIGDRVTCP